MEAPKKIYLYESDRAGEDYENEWGTFPWGDCVEYIRTDAFIEKACKWLEKNADKYIWYSDYAEFPGNDTCGMNVDFIEDFKNYMKGE